MTTEEILSKAKELGEMIAESDEVKGMIEAQKALVANDDAQTMLDSYNELNQQYQGAHNLNDSNTMKEVRQKMEDMAEKLTNNSLIQAYAEARQKLDKLIGHVNNIMSYHMSGGVEGCTDDGCDGCGDECGGGCSCGGCH